MSLKNLFLLCFLVSTSSANKTSGLEFTDENFDSEMSQHETALVMFYAPWCQHCQKLKPEFAEAAEHLISHKPPITLARVDCSGGGKKTCDKYKVEGYPTLKIFRSGDLAENYDGKRSGEGIIQYMKDHVSSSCQEVSSCENLEEFLKAENKIALIGFFENESNLKIALCELAAKLKNKVRFGYSYNETVLIKLGVNNGIVLFRQYQLRNKFEDNSVVYSGGATTEEINDFIKKNYHGLVGHRTPENVNEFEKPFIVVYYNIDYKNKAQETRYWRNRVLKIAQQYKNKINFATSTKEDFQTELRNSGIEDIKSDKPVVVARDVDNQKFRMKILFSLENFEKFARYFSEGKLKPYIKSQPIPRDNNGPVKIAVTKNFDDVVVNNGKDTILAFYAPWCDHCKKLAPLYYELGDKLKDENVDVVKMDATSNEVPHKFNVEELPAIYWLPEDSKSSPVVYKGKRKMEHFIKYVAKYATHELKGYDRNGNLKVLKSEL